MLWEWLVLLQILHNQDTPVSTSWMCCLLCHHAPPRTPISCHPDNKPPQHCYKKSVHAPDLPRPVTYTEDPTVSKTWPVKNKQGVRHIETKQSWKHFPRAFIPAFCVPLSLCCDLSEIWVNCMFVVVSVGVMNYSKSNETPNSKFLASVLSV